MSECDLSDLNVSVVGVVVVVVNFFFTFSTSIPNRRTDMLQIIMAVPWMEICIEVTLLNVGGEKAKMRALHVVIY